MNSLAEAMPIEQARVREVLCHYREIGAAGAWGAAIIEHALRNADQAMASGDVVAIIRAFSELQKIED